jgi:Zn-finger nucleic acid-binding protein
MSVFRESPPVEPAPRCPRDGSELATHVVEAVTLRVCARCSGVWLDADALVALLSDRQRMDGLALHPLATPARRVADDERALPCCRCSKPSDRREYGEDTRIFVDVCEPHGIWLDGGELHAVIRYARGAARPLAASSPEARRGALRGMPRRRKAASAPSDPPPPREFDDDAEWLLDVVHAITWLWR